MAARVARSTDVGRALVIHHAKKGTSAALWWVTQDRLAGSRFVRGRPENDRRCGEGRSCRPLGPRSLLYPETNLKPSARWSMDILSEDRTAGATTRTGEGRLSDESIERI